VGKENQKAKGVDDFRKKKDTKKEKKKSPPKTAKQQKVFIG